MTAPAPDLLSPSRAPRQFPDPAERTARLRAALPRHACVACGVFGPFRIDKRWWCFGHVGPGAGGLWAPTAEGVVLAGERAGRV